MSRADGILDLVVKERPYRDIERGFKLEEYRGHKWASRIFSDSANIDCEGRVFMERSMMKYFTGEIAKSEDAFHPYHTARISLGYRSGRPSMIRKICRIRWGMPNPEWTYGIVSGEDCFVIELEAP